MAGIIAITFFLFALTLILSWVVVFTKIPDVYKTLCLLAVFLLSLIRLFYLLVGAFTATGADYEIMQRYLFWNIASTYFHLIWPLILLINFVLILQRRKRRIIFKVSIIGIISILIAAILTAHYFR